MKQKLLALRNLASNRKTIAVVALSAASVPAFAEGTDVSASITTALGAIVPAIVTAMTTTISQVAPVIALALGIAYAVRMVRKQAK